MDPRFLDFIDEEGERRILEAIGRAERHSSGEIRVHLHRGGGADVYQRAVDTFNRLKMYKTRLRNGILIYVDTRGRRFAVIGDEGIHRKVGSAFWEQIRDILAEHFRQGQYTEGIVKAIDAIGLALAEHFPYSEDDVNELPDELSFD